MNLIIDEIVVCTVVALGMLFLTHTIFWDGQRDILAFGAAVALVMAALSIFLKQRQ